LLSADWVTTHPTGCALAVSAPSENSEVSPKIVKETRTSRRRLNIDNLTASPTEGFQMGAGIKPKVGLIPTTDERKALGIAIAMTRPTQKFSKQSK
jgi:hypothetical protein